MRIVDGSDGKIYIARWPYPGGILIQDGGLRFHRDRVGEDDERFEDLAFAMGIDVDKAK